MKCATLQMFTNIKGRAKVERVLLNQSKTVFSIFFIFVEKLSITLIRLGRGIKILSVHMILRVERIDK